MWIRRITLLFVLSVSPRLLPAAALSGPSAPQAAPCPPATILDDSHAPPLANPHGCTMLRWGIGFVDFRFGFGNVLRSGYTGSLRYTARTVDGKVVSSNDDASAPPLLLGMDPNSLDIALEEIGVTLQPLASIAKKEEVIYVHGQEDDPVVLDRRSPVLHLVQQIRDESHRFAVTYHRKRRQMRDRDSELDAIQGVGPRTRQRLLEHFGSVRGIKQASPDALTAVVNAATAERIRQHFAEDTSSLVQIA